MKPNSDSSPNSSHPPENLHDVVERAAEIAVALAAADPSTRADMVAGVQHELATAEVQVVDAHPADGIRRGARSGRTYEEVMIDRARLLSTKRLRRAK